MEYPKLSILTPTSFYFCYKMNLEKDLIFID